MQGMDDSRKKPGMAFRAAVVMVVLLVLYPLSFGPACWIVSRMGIPSAPWLPLVYRPLLWALAPDYTVRSGFVMPRDGSIGSAFRWYARIGAADESWNWQVLVHDDGKDEWEWAPPHFGTER
jgi:hypothetical protein